VFRPQLTKWPECACYLDIEETDCKGHKYHMRYQNDKGDVAASVLDLSLPTDTKDWTITMEMDMDVKYMGPRSAQASSNVLPIKSNTLLVRPTASADYSQETQRVEIEYDLKVSSTSWR